jgi:hypothetical protein
MQGPTTNYKSQQAHMMASDCLSFPSKTAASAGDKLDAAQHCSNKHNRWNLLVMGHGGNNLCVDVQWHNPIFGPVEVPRLLSFSVLEVIAEPVISHVFALQTAATKATACCCHRQHY